MMRMIRRVSVEISGRCSGTTSGSGDTVTGEEVAGIASDWTLGGSSAAGWLTTSSH